MTKAVSSAFAARYRVNGSLRYIAVPAIVAERMGLEKGDDLDVIIKFPTTNPETTKKQEEESKEE